MKPGFWAPMPVSMDVTDLEASSRRPHTGQTVCPSYTGGVYGFDGSLGVLTCGVLVDDDEDDLPPPRCPPRHCPSSGIVNTIKTASTNSPVDLRLNFPVF